MVREVGRVAILDVYPSGEKTLTERVARTLKDTIAELDCGLQIDAVNMIGIRPPVSVKEAFDLLLEMVQVSEKMAQDATREADKMLIEAAGEGGPALGKVVESWWEAKEEGRTEDMKAIDEEIRRLYANAGGEVRTILAEARAYRTAIAESAKRDAEQITSLLANPAEDVKIFLDYIRIEALQDVLEQAFEKYLYRPAAGNNGRTRPTLELWMNRRPEILRKQTEVPDTF